MSRALRVFNLVSVDGYIAGADGDISWHRVDAEFHEFAARNLVAGGPLLFGRVTYQLMAAYWPTPEAIRSDPAVALRMNDAEKIVYSRTLPRADWDHSRLVRDDMLGDVRRMKTRSGPNLTILGSASLVAQLTQVGLIDEYQVMINPVALGAGRTQFEGITRHVGLELTDLRRFANGNVLLTYRRH